MQTVIKIPFKSHGHSCVVEQDATGYLWFYIDNLTLALLPACVPEWLREEGEARLNGANKGVKKCRVGRQQRERNDEQDSRPPRRKLPQAGKDTD